MNLQRLLSIATIVIGIVVLLYGIFAEDEPTLVAPLLILGGAVWYFVTRSKMGSRKAKHIK